jgi:hypothetical protein
MDFSRILLASMVCFILAAKLYVVQGATPQITIDTDVTLSLAIENENDVLDNMKKIFGEKKLPIFWKRQLIELECAGKLMGNRIVASEKGRTLRKFIGIEPAQMKRLATLITDQNRRGNRQSIAPIRDVATAYPALFDFFNEALYNVTILLKAHSDSFNNTLTKDQLQRARKLELVLSPIVDEDWEFSINFDAYEVLGLSQDQRDKLLTLKLQHAELQDKVALMIAGVPLPVINQYALENSSPIDQNNYSEKRLAQKKELCEEVKNFKAEVKNKVEAILNPPQRDRLEKLRREIPKKLAAIRLQVLKEKQEKEAADKAHYPFPVPLPTQEENSTPNISPTADDIFPEPHK